MPPTETVTVPPTPRADEAPTLAPEPTTGTDPGPRTSQVPGYEVQGELGRGGMGVVYQARQVKANRVVALKMILAGGHADAAQLERFRTEAEAVARLQHPNIVQVFEVGEHDGLPFFSLEFCAGGSLEKKLNGTPLLAKEAAALVETLARAMEAAHRQNVIHRDLKPANVLLTMDGTPKVTDFGLAKKLDDDSGATRTGAIMGTPSYMAPEQAEGKKDVGPAADVYALGAILYEGLTGRPPFKAATPFDTVLQVVSEEPVPVRRLQPKVPRDLETVCHKCLHKEPGRRYASAAALADDLRRFQAGEPIAARPVSWPERLLRWERRNPVVAALILLVGVLTAAGLAAFGWAFNQVLSNEVRAIQESIKARNAETKAKEEEGKAKQESVKAREAEEQAKKDRDAAEEQKQAAQMAEARAKDEEEKAKARAEEYRRAVANSKIMLADASWREGLVDRVRDRLNEIPNNLRFWEWNYLNRLRTGGIFTTPGGYFTLAGHASAVCGVAFSPDGQLLATASRDKTAKIWDARTGQLIRTLRGHTLSLTGVVFSPDGLRLATAGDDNTARVWDTRTGKESFSLKGHSDRVSSVAFSPDGLRLATGSIDHTARVWDARTGNELFSFKGFPSSVDVVAFSPDGLRLATSSGPTRSVWNANTGQELLSVTETSSSGGVAFSPDGQRLATHGGNLVRVLDAHTGQEVLSFKPFFLVTSLVFSPDGQRLATGGGIPGRPGEAKVWHARTGQELLSLKGHASLLGAAQVNSVAFSPDGQRLATACDDMTTKVWDARPDQQQLSLRGHTDWVRGAAFSPDGQCLASASNDKTAILWDARTGQLMATLRGHTLSVISVAFSPDGHLLATAGGEAQKPGEAKVWDARTSQVLFSLQGHTDWVRGVAFSPDGQLLATASSDKTAKIWDARTGQPLRTFRGHTLYVSGVAFSPDSLRLATTSFDGTAKVWDAQSGQELFSLSHNATVTSVAFSPDGQRLATACGQTGVYGEAKLWNAQTGKGLFSLKGHTSAAWSVAFSPDGQRLITTSEDKKIKVWDALSGQELLTLEGHAGKVWSVAFSPDGQRMATASSDRTVKVWDARPVAVSPDAEELLIRRARTRPDFDWHAEEARRQEKEQQWLTAAFHLEHLLTLRPGEALHNRLSQALVKAISQTPHPLASTWRRLALAQLFAGQTTEGLNTCTAMRQRFTVPGPVCRVIQSLRVSPHDTLAAALTARLLYTPAWWGEASDFDRLLTARTGVLLQNGLPDPLAWLPAVPESEPTTRAALLCRAGQHAEAIAMLQPLKEPRAHLWRALAEHGRGDKAAAQKAFDEALAEMERICPSDTKADATPLPWEQRAEYEILEREVKAALE